MIVYIRIISFTFLALFSICSKAATLLYFDSANSTWVGQGESRLASLSNDYDFIVEPIWGNGLSIKIVRDLGHLNPLNDSWMLRFSTPFGGPLVEGLYLDAYRYPFQDADQPGLDFSGNSRMQNISSGFYEILDIEFDSNGTLNTLAIDFTQYENFDRTRWLSGSLRYNSGIAVVPLPSAFLFFLSSLLLIANLMRERQWRSA